MQNIHNAISDLSLDGPGLLGWPRSPCDQVNPSPCRAPLDAFLKELDESLGAAKPALTGNYKKCGQCVGFEVLAKACAECYSGNLDMFQWNKILTDASASCNRDGFGCKEINFNVTLMGTPPGQIGNLPIIGIIQQWGKGVALANACNAVKKSCGIVWPPRPFTPYY